MADFTAPPSHSSVHKQLHLHPQQQVANPKPEPPPPTPATTPLPPSSGESNRKRKGRPSGSKNKPKTPIYITQPPEPTMKFMQLHIPAGLDVVDMLMNFARKIRVGLHILGGSGSISSFTTLRQPPVTLSRALNLVSLGGTFVDSPVAIPWLTIFFNGNTTNVMGSTVVSKALAATDVVVNVIAFKSGSEYCYRLDPQMFVGEDQKGWSTFPGCSSGTGSVVNGGAMPLSAVRFGIPMQHLNWAPPAVNYYPATELPFPGFQELINI